MFPGKDTCAEGGCFAFRFLTGICFYNDHPLIIGFFVKGNRNGISGVCRFHPAAVGYDFSMAGYLNPAGALPDAVRAFGPAKLRRRRVNSYWLCKSLA